MQIIDFKVLRNNKPQNEILFSNSIFIGVKEFIKINGEEWSLLLFVIYINAIQNRNKAFINKLQYQIENLDREKLNQEIKNGDLGDSQIKDYNQLFLKYVKTTKQSLIKGENSQSIRNKFKEDI